MRTPPLKLKAGIHRVGDIPLTRYARRVFHDPHLMTYYHTKNRVWVLGSWVSKSGGIILEHGLLKPGEEFETLMNLRWQRSEQARLDQRRMVVELGASERADLRQQADDADEEYQFIQWFRSRCRETVRDHPGWEFC